VDNEHAYQIYKELAEREAERGADQLRDRFLILAADAALMAGRAHDADQLRDRLLEGNPRHLLKPFESMADAIHSPEVANYLADLRRSYPPEEAERLLQSLHGAPIPVKEEESEAPPPLSRLFADQETAPEPARDILPMKKSLLPEPAPALIPPAYRPEPAHEPARGHDAEDAPSAVSNVVATGLFIVVVLAALALAGHVFVRPFLVS
jgi:hypothetical protein